VRGWEHRADILWREAYADLAGWLVAIVGDEQVAHAVAGETFVRLFSGLLPVRRSRTTLFATALRVVELSASGGRESAGERATAATWLSDLTVGLPPLARRALLLHHGGLDPWETARALNLPVAKVTRALRSAGLAGSVPGQLGDELGPRADAQLDEDVAQMELHRLGADEERRRDVPVAQP
jgi:DNA-directed RNA polymerase specialized sigma24 family protein